MSTHYKDVLCRRDQIDLILYRLARTYDKRSDTKIIIDSKRIVVFGRQCEKDNKIHIHYKNNGKITFTVDANNEYFETEFNRIFNEIYQNKTESSTINTVYHGIKIATIESVLTEAQEFNVDKKEDKKKTTFTVTLKEKAHHLKTEEKITLTHYDSGYPDQSGKLHIQGMAINCFYIFTIKFAQILDEKTLYEVISKGSERFEIFEENEEQLKEDFENILKIEKSKIPENIYKLMWSGYLLERSNKDLKVEEYSFFCHSSLRALEGALKKYIFEKNNRGIESNLENLGDHFDYDKITREYSLKKPTTNQEQNKRISEIYKFFKDKRNPLFHTGWVDSYTEMISNKNDALQITSQSRSYVVEIMRFL